MVWFGYGTVGVVLRFLDVVFFFGGGRFVELCGTLKGLLRIFMFKIEMRVRIDRSTTATN